MRELVLTVEGIVCTAPCYILGMFGGAMLLATGVTRLSEAPLSGATYIAFVLGVWFALSQLGLLLVLTSQDRKYQFSRSFWVAAAIGIGTACWILLTFPPFWAALVVVPAFLVISHFLAIQRKLHSEGASWAS